MSVSLLTSNALAMNKAFHIQYDEQENGIWHTRKAIIWAESYEIAISDLTDYQNITLTDEWESQLILPSSHSSSLSIPEEETDIECIPAYPLELPSVLITEETPEDFLPYMKN